MRCVVKIRTLQSCCRRARRVRTGKSAQIAECDQQGSSWRGEPILRHPVNSQGSCCNGREWHAHWFRNCRCDRDNADRSRECPWRQSRPRPDGPIGVAPAVRATGGAVDAAGAARGTSGATRAGKSAIRRSLDTGRYPAGHLPDRDAGSGAGRSRGLRDCRQKRPQQRRRGHGAHRGHHRQPGRARPRRHHRLRRIPRHRHAKDRRRLARAEILACGQAGRDHAGAHPQPGEGGAGIQTR